MFYHVPMIEKRRGAPIGNQNARKHGFYSNVLDVAEKHDLKKASQLKGLDEEIDLLRVKIKSIAEHDPDNIRLISQVAVSLSRLLRVRETVFNKSKDANLGQAIQNIVRDIGVPLGFGLPEKTKNKF
jgi:hypothetical protein